MDSENMLEELFGTAKPIIGVVHLLPLPGSVRWDGYLEPIFLRAEQEALALESGGANGIIIENFFDVPFARHRVDTATACAMALAVKRIMTLVNLPIGINVLSNDAKSALAIASTTGAQFIRVNVLTAAVVPDQRLIEDNAHDLHMYRRQLLANKNVKIFADILMKHTNPLFDDIEISLLAKEAVYKGLADAVVVTGRSMELSPSVEDLNKVRQSIPKTPILVGGDVRKENIGQFISIADGVIVENSFKRQENIDNPIDPERVRHLVNASKPVKTLLP